MMIKVLCIIDKLECDGGAERLLLSLAPELKILDIDLEFVELFQWPDELDLRKELENLGFKVHQANISHRWSLVEGCMKLRKIILTGKFDIVWGHLDFANMHMQMTRIFTRGIKSIVTLHSEKYLVFPERSFFGMFKNYIRNLLLIKADYFIGVSHSVVNLYVKHYKINSISVIHNGVVTSCIKSHIPILKINQIRVKYGIDLEDFLIVVPARLVKVKGHIYLLQALKIMNIAGIKLPKIIFLGEKVSEYINLKNYIENQSLDNYVSIVDPLNHTDLFELILASNAAVFPSLSEAFGIAAAEAMATGTPVILTKVGGLIELVGDSGCALMVKPEKPQELADAILLLMLNKNFADELGSKGRERVINNFDIGICAKEWRRRFSSVISNE